MTSDIVSVTSLPLTRVTRGKLARLAAPGASNHQPVPGTAWYKGPARDFCHQQQRCYFYSQAAMMQQSLVGVNEV